MVLFVCFFFGFLFVLTCCSSFPSDQLVGCCLMCLRRPAGSYAPGELLAAYETEDKDCSQVSHSLLTRWSSRLWLMLPGRWLEIDSSFQITSPEGWKESDLKEQKKKMYVHQRHCFFFFSNSIVTLEQFLFEVCAFFFFFFLLEMKSVVFDVHM